jgi:uncharacterized protein
MDTTIDRGPFFVTVSGKVVYFLDPDPDQITIEDVAHALSRISRWGGHTNSFWSVAAHSLLVAQLLPRPLKLAGLTHDLHEYVLGDMPTPLKSLIPEYPVIAAKWDGVVGKKFGVDLHDPAIKMADTIALATERRDLRNNGEQWPIDAAAAQFHIVPTSIELTQAAFLKEFYFLTQ